MDSFISFVRAFIGSKSKIEDWTWQVANINRLVLIFFFPDRVGKGLKTWMV